MAVGQREVLHQERYQPVGQTEAFVRLQIEFDHQLMCYFLHQEGNDGAKVTRRYGEPFSVTITNQDGSIKTLSFEHPVKRSKQAESATV